MKEEIALRWLKKAENDLKAVKPIVKIIVRHSRSSYRTELRQVPTS